jgi:hypothetical protein
MHCSCRWNISHPTSVCSLQPGRWMESGADMRKVSSPRLGYKLKDKLKVLKHLIPLQWPQRLWHLSAGRHFFVENGPAFSAPWSPRPLFLLSAFLHNLIYFELKRDEFAKFFPFPDHEESKSLTCKSVYVLNERFFFTYMFEKIASLRMHKSF